MIKSRITCSDQQRINESIFMIGAKDDWRVFRNVFQTCYFDLAIIQTQADPNNNPKRIIPEILNYNHLIYVIDIVLPFRDHLLEILGQLRVELNKFIGGWVDKT